ncbi:bestrophin family protein, partial [Methylobacterium radiotolerans]|uniref:bestrophin family protein n=1 Tax=Methylobacterium radiotolerans TaxID=31998 RepID=UPI000978495B
PNLMAVLFTLQGSILPRVALKVSFITAAAIGVVALERAWPHPFPMSAGIGPFTLVGLALSIFLSFRNGACYDRWWEARKAWGTLILEARSFARLLAALLPEERHRSLRLRALKRVMAFAKALHAQMRREDEVAAATPWLPEAEATDLHARPSPAEAVLVHQMADLGRARREGALSDILFGLVEQKVAALGQVQIVCERIQSTPLPFAYTLLLYRTAWIYCLLLPFGLAGTLGWVTPLVTALVAYTFFGLDALGDELEDPFGTEPTR